MKAIIDKPSIQEKPITGVNRDTVWTSGFICIFITNLFVCMNLHMLWPTIPMYILSIGGNEKVVGLFAGFYTLMSIIARPISGMLLDRYKRKLILISGILLLVIVAVGHIFAAILPFLFLVRLLHGLANSVTSTSINTTASDMLPPSRIGEGMGLFSMSTSISISISPMIGIALLNKTSYLGLFLSNLLLALGSLFIAFFALRDTGLKTNNVITNDAKKINLNDFFERSAVLPAVIIILIYMISGFITSFISLFALQEGVENIGFFFSGMALTTLLSRPFAGRFVDKSGPNLIIGSGFILTIITLLITSFSQSNLHFIIDGLLFGIGLAIFLPSMQALVIKNTSQERRGAAMGTFYIGLDLGSGLGAFLGGILVTSYGFQHTFLLGTIPVSLAAIIYIFGRKKGYF